MTPAAPLPPGPGGAAGQYFSAEPAAPSRPGSVTLTLPDLRAELAVDRGVFSAGRVDPGTVALLRALPAELPGGAGAATEHLGGAGPATAEGDALLDLGCGYGPIACTLAHRYPARAVWALDVNRRALALAAANAGALGLGNVRTAEPDAVPPDLRFGAIVSNPPIRIGKDALHGLMEAWLPRLAPGGEAWLVVQRHLGADSLAAWLGGWGWRAERAGSKQGYRILRVRREG